MPNRLQVLSMAALMLPVMAAKGFSVPDKEGFSAHVSGWSAIDSAYVSKGRTCHDGLVWNPSATVSDFGIGENRFPAYVGFWNLRGGITVSVVILVGKRYNSTW